MQRTSEVTKYLGFSLSEVTRTINLLAIAEACGIDLQDLRFDSAKASPGKVVLSGQALRPRQLSIHAGRRACSQCLRADLSHPFGNRLPRSWHRNWWDVQPVTVCSIHGSLLLFRCDSCRAKLDFLGTRIGCCPNGHSIVAADRPIATYFAGDSYIVARLGGTSLLNHKLLDTGSLGSAIDAMEIVGAAAMSLKTPSSNVLAHDVLNAGFYILSDWPQAFDRLLEGLSSSSKMGVGRWGAAAAYGSLHTQLIDLPDGAIAIAIRDRVRRHAAKKGISGSKPVFGKISQHRAFLSVSETARALGSGYETTRALLKSRGLILANTRRGTPINVPVQVVKALTAASEENLTLSQLSKRLGIGRSQTRAVLRSSVFGECQQSEKFAAVIIDCLSSKFDASRSTVVTHCISLPDACRIGKCPIEKALLAILKGRLHIARLDRRLEGLKQFHVVVQDVRKLGKEHRSDVSFSDAADQLKVKWEVVRQLVAIKYLRRRGTRIRRDSLTQFQLAYVRGSDIAREIGVRPQTFLRLARHVRLRPKIGPPVCRQVFFRRTEVSRVRPAITVDASRRRPATGA